MYRVNALCFNYASVSDAVEDSPIMGSPNTVARCSPRKNRGPLVIKRSVHWPSVQFLLGGLSC